jgi:hypothetical protein
MNTITETMKVWVSWKVWDGEEADEETLTIPEMDDDAIVAYLEDEHQCFVIHWDHTEECGHCGHLATKTMWDKGKVDCCQHCCGCDSYKPYGADWAEEAKWGADNEGDLCPDCVQYYLKCAHCNARGVDTKNAEGEWIHSDCGDDCDPE